MKVIRILHDADVAGNNTPPEHYIKREAARAIVFDSDNNVALLNVTKKSYHKLPGGGIEKGESIESALRREILEEIGCRIGEIEELGIIEEYRNEESLHQISYCFITHVVGEKGEPELEEGEIADGFEVVWLSLRDALQTLTREANVQDHEGKFIRLRDLTFIQSAEQLLRSGIIGAS